MGNTSPRSPELPDVDDVYQAIREHPAPFLSTGEVDEQLGAEMSRPALLNRLNELEEDGRLSKREVGGNTHVWYPPEQLNRRLAEYSDTDGGEKDEPEVRAGGGVARGTVEERLLESNQQMKEKMEGWRSRALTLQTAGKLILFSALVTFIHALYPLPKPAVLIAGLSFWSAAVIMYMVIRNAPEPETAEQ